MADVYDRLNIVFLLLNDKNDIFGLIPVTFKNKNFVIKKYIDDSSASITVYDYKGTVKIELIVEYENNPRFSGYDFWISSFIFYNDENDDDDNVTHGLLRVTTPSGYNYIYDNVNIGPNLSADAEFFLGNINEMFLYYKAHPSVYNIIKNRDIDHQFFVIDKLQL